MGGVLCDISTGYWKAWSKVFNIRVCKQTTRHQYPVQILLAAINWMKVLIFILVLLLCSWNVSWRGDMSTPVFPFRFHFDLSEGDSLMLLNFCALWCFLMVMNIYIYSLNLMFAFLCYCYSERWCVVLFSVPWVHTHPFSGGTATSPGAASDISKHHIN